uniref:Odorant receptor n=3 Tax=Dendrolimus kikuchii TaxID=765133 RepID=A0A076E9C3_9NEOP|nr:odorant receptor [Dendrolimus kikuchii]
MSTSSIKEAKKEIEDSLILSLFCCHRLGLSFTPPKTKLEYYSEKLVFIMSVSAMSYHVFSDIVYISLILSKSPGIEDVVPLLHTFSYGVLSISKVFALSYKRLVFAQLIDELATIWPMPPLDEESENIKRKRLAGLRLAHRWYFTINMIGVGFYCVTPIITYFYHYFQGQESTFGFVWVSWYPFDKYSTIGHFVVYVFEIFIGMITVWIMVSTDLLFSGMASHIGLLLMLLKKRLESFASDEQTQDEYYHEIKECIKLHQRLIRFCNDLEEAFTQSNFVNIILSSVNICCVVFVIVLLEPVIAMSNKMYLVANLIQIGLICYYADDILHANADIAQAAYSNSWYRTDTRCRRALLFLIQRAQKPIEFTAMNFTNISLVTYTAILTKSYSYFALIYTMYTKN